MFENATLDLNKIYLSPRLATNDTTLRSFQYEILNNVLFLDKKLYTFGITNTALCSFCNTLEETPMDIFFDCFYVNPIRPGILRGIKSMGRGTKNHTFENPFLIVKML